MPDATSFPPIPADLLARLDRLYPEQCPDPANSEREIWMKAGARGVIRFLKAEADRQDANQPLLRKR